MDEMRSINITDIMLSFHQPDLSLSLQAFDTTPESMPLPLLRSNHSIPLDAAIEYNVHLNKGQQHLDL